MKQWEAALVVLSESSSNSLHFREIANRIIAFGYCTFKTDTPAQSVRVAMTDRCPHKRLFKLISDGEYQIQDTFSATSLLQKIRTDYPEVFYQSSIREEIESMRNREEMNGAFGNFNVPPEGSFDLQDIIDGRERILASIVRRQGQSGFRASLLLAYNRKCAITDCGVELLLDAAHITPYKGPATNHTGNGLLLRTDLHTLFDLGLVAVETETMTLLISEELTGTCYESYRGKRSESPMTQRSVPIAGRLMNIAVTGQGESGRWGKLKYPT